MALVSTDDRHYKNIAQAIRNKLGTEELLLPEQMAGAINSIGGFMKNYQGTTIHADDTYYCNMVSNRNKIEVLGQTIQNCANVNGFIYLEAYNIITSNTVISTSFPLMKNATTYTCFLSGASFADKIDRISITDGNGLNNNVLGYGKFANRKATFITNIIYPTTNNVIYLVTTEKLSESEKQELDNLKIMILEGDWTDKEVN